jgi:hypothetical protein
MTKDRGHPTYGRPAVPDSLLVRVAVLIGALLVSLAPARAADLSATEQRWLQGLWPVIEHARRTAIPLDIVVQPQPTPGLAPLALAFVDGRCKLVLSMRGNPEAQATLERIAGDLGADRLDAALELMGAHEVLGHCRRHLDGQWHRVPAGVVDVLPESLPAELRADFLAMRATRREEGFADLAGLAWARERHPALYATLHDWLVAERARDLIDGSHHDTLAWLHRLDEDLRRAPAAAPMARVSVLWRDVVESERH